MKKQVVSALLVSILLFLMIPVSSVFAAGLGDSLPEPEEGWARFNYDHEYFTYEGEPWDQCKNSSCYQSKWQTSGAAIKFNFTGTKLRYISNTWETSSKSIKVIIDGVEVKPFSLYGTPDNLPKIMYEQTGLADKEHSIEIINNTKEYLHLKAIDLDGTGELRPFNPIGPDNPNPDPEPEPNPEPKPEPEQPKGDRALLVITMTTGLEKEFDLSMDEVNAFINWYDAKDTGSGPSKYAIDKHNNNKGPFSKRTDYVIFNNILTFEVNEYTVK
ncbi:bacterial surface protein [Paenibacillus dendritiformis]|uniref:bacterial surface protein n=1 Tax=Paenibacillus dendritiformis TaxID=130049 RepID=UPI00105A7D3F|nr:bacterial surface protein [Paenibacillus dendritiformis]TDL50939.1 bacterial surface protein [Paenibacillus dendritiformis]